MPDVVRRNFRQYDKDNGQAGLLIPTGVGWTFSSVVAAASTARVCRFQVSRPMTVVSMGVGVSNNATTDDSSGVAIYDATGATRLATSGALTGKMNAGSTTAPRTFALTASYTVVPRTTYYGMFLYGTTAGTAATLVTATYALVMGARMFGNTLGTLEGDTVASATNGVPPASFAAANTGAAPFAMTLLES